jgi:two-component sensor histidine kinase
LGLGTIIALRLATQLALSQADRELLINELQHRVKNTLATLQGLVVSTLRSAASLADARKAVDERIVGLGCAHDGGYRHGRQRAADQRGEIWRCPSYPRIAMV